MPIDNENNSRNETGVYSSRLGDFETRKLSVLKSADIKEGDRVIVTTIDGNRYMFRRSKSAQGHTKVYKEKAGDFEKELAICFI